MYVLLAGLNHKTAPLVVREKFAFTTRQKESLYTDLKKRSALESLMIVSTCNRTELYAVTRSKADGKKALQEILLQKGGQDAADLTSFLYEKDCDDAVRHLYRVTSGLDSMILGETQILGQMKQAYQEAVESSATDRVMNQLMQKAFFVGKKVHTLTGIDQHPVSVSYAAVEAAKNRVGSLAGKKVLVVGAGEAGQLAARYLKEEGVQAVFVSNRSEDAAQALAQDLNGTAVKMAQLPVYLQTVDIVISCTGASHLVIHGEDCQKALRERNGKPLLFIDIAVPRDVDPALSDIEGTEILDMDQLQRQLFKEQEERLKAACLGEAIIQEEMEAFRAYSAALHVTPVIAALKERGTEIRERELHRAFNRLQEEHLSEREKRVMREMAQAIVNQLLREPVEQLKELAESGQGEAYAAALKTLFVLPVEKIKEAQGEDEREVS